MSSGGGTVDFQEFVGGLSAFSSRGGRDEKLRCAFVSTRQGPFLFASTHDDFCSPVAFKVYDVDRDGFISNGELFLVLKMMVGNNLKVRISLSLFTSPYVLKGTPPGSATATNCRQDYHGSRSGW